MVLGESFSVSELCRRFGGVLQLQSVPRGGTDAGQEHELATTAESGETAFLSPQAEPGGIGGPASTGGRPA